METSAPAATHLPPTIPHPTCPPPTIPHPTCPPPTMPKTHPTHTPVTSQHTRTTHSNPIPVQVLVDSPALLPKRPGSQSEHVEAPEPLYFPAGHCVTVAVVEPAGHMYPALQSPVQAFVVNPVADPNLPAEKHAPWHPDTDTVIRSQQAPPNQKTAHTETGGGKRTHATAKRCASFATAGVGMRPWAIARNVSGVGTHTCRALGAGTGTPSAELPRRTHGLGGAGGADGAEVPRVAVACSTYRGKGEYHMRSRVRVCIAISS